jgi:predicted lipoprotein with Yx(FWY)xxD motif
MITLKRFVPISFMFFVALLVAACGSATSGSGSPPSSSAPTPTPSPAAQTASVMTSTATINGKSVTFLVNSAGMTLYYRTSDTATSVCSGGCAGAWPPLLSSATPTTSASLPGKLGVISDTNGSQATYNGHPLYTFSGDTAAGQTNGEGVGGVWFVAAINISPMSASTSGSYSGY